MATDKALDNFATLTPAGVLPKVNTIFDFSAEALQELRLWLEQNPPAIGISNILGFSQFTAQTSTFIPASESTTSTTYTDLATVGPTITGLSDGQYLVLIGAIIDTGTPGQRAIMSVSVNGTTPADGDGVESRNSQLTTCSGFSLQTLAAGGNNTITAKYRTDLNTATAFFGSRKMVALRYANK